MILDKCFHLPEPQFSHGQDEDNQWTVQIVQPLTSTQQNGGFKRKQGKATHFSRDCQPVLAWGLQITFKFTGWHNKHVSEYKNEIQELYLSPQEYTSSQAKNFVNFSFACDIECHMQYGGGGSFFFLDLHLSYANQWFQMQINSALLKIWALEKFCVNL